MTSAQLCDGESLGTTLPPDAALPQLPQALDPATMASVFSELLQPHGTRLERCVVDRVKYRPGRNATLGYKLMLRDAQQRPFVQHVAARLCGPDGEQRATRAATAALTPSAAGPALRWLPGLGMLTWWWPNDAKLRAPHVLSSDRRLREHLLPALMQALCGVSGGEGAGAGGTPGKAPAAASSAREVQVTTDIVQYVPEHRLCARLDLAWQDACGAHRRRLYAKSSREPDGATAHGVMTQLQASSAWREGRLRTPRAVLWHAPTELYVQEGLPGQALLEAGLGMQQRCAAPLGAQLAALHGTPVRLARALTRDGMKARLVDVTATLSPVLGEALVHRAARALEDGLRLLDGAPLATLHGDFHVRNILVEDNVGTPRVALIDLDGARRGPPVLELGAWIADGMYSALLNGAQTDRDAPQWRTLLAAYVDAGGAPPDAQTLRWATGWSLLTQRAWRCVLNVKPGRFALAPVLVQAAAKLALGKDVTFA